MAEEKAALSTVERIGAAPPASATGSGTVPTAVLRLGFLALVLALWWGAARGALGPLRVAGGGRRCRASASSPRAASARRS